jgi:hypothetical protein
MYNLLEVISSNGPWAIGAYIGVSFLYRCPFFMKRRAKDMLIDFDKAHQHVVLGTTGTGKTYGAAHSLAKSNKGVLFFNTVHADSVPSSFIKADSSTDLDLINRALRKGKKINFIPSFNPDLRDKQMAAVINYFLDGSKRDYMIFAVDEVHLYKKDAKTALIGFATVARNMGMKGVFISQRPANVENQILEMCGQWALYLTPMSPKWFNDYSMPGDKIVSELEKSPEYSYLIYSIKDRSLKGPFKV